MSSLTQVHVVFRADSSIQIGTGHVMRCLTLADALRERGARCTFICRSDVGHMLEEIALRGHQFVSLPLMVTEERGGLPTDSFQNAWLSTDWQIDSYETRRALGEGRVDWLVVDHYALDYRWESTLRPHCQNLMVIDDMADRPHDCDLLLDQTLGRREKDYSQLVNPHTALYVGPEYALLRPEFAELRHQSLARRNQHQLRHLLITMGGIDKENATLKVLQSLNFCPLPDEIRITVVMGSNAPGLEDVILKAAQMHWPTKVLVGVSDMAQHMADSDLCIGAAGSTSWERCCLGLPSIIFIIAENQREIGSALESVGAVVAIRDELFGMQNEISALLVDNSKLLLMSQRAAEVTDGRGVLRISEILFKKK